MSRNTFAERLLAIARHTVAPPPLTVSTMSAPSLRRMFMTWSFTADSPAVGVGGVGLPARGGELGAGEHPARPRHEGEQDVELGPGEPDGDPAPR